LIAARLNGAFEINTCGAVISKSSLKVEDVCKKCKSFEAEQILACYHCISPF